jgi:SAM-dependent methyltransferase
MDARLEANLKNWNDRVRIHAESRFYNVEGWLHKAPGPPTWEIDALGDLEGKSLVHLQCHFGMDTMQWARAGATVTGLDFSLAAIDEANALAERAGLSECASFVCANIYDAPRALSEKRFDVVYISLGALCWLPDVAAWGAVVADLLAPGGRLYLHDGHPFTSCFDDDGEQVIYSYFEEPDSPAVSDSPSTYTELQATGAEPTNLIFEITETAVMGDIEVGVQFTKALTDFGCGVSLDDFGTGFGSFNYLKRLFVQQLKIDIEFVRDLLTNEANQHLVRAIVSMAKAFNLQTVAEGVEDQETWDFLRVEGVDFGQGFHLGRPTPIG